MYFFDNNLSIQQNGMNVLYFGKTDRLNFQSTYMYIIHMHCTVCKERPLLPRADAVSNQAHGFVL